MTDGSTVSTVLETQRYFGHSFAYLFWHLSISNIHVSGRFGEFEEIRNPSEGESIPFVEVSLNVLGISDEAEFEEIQFGGAANVIEESEVGFNGRTKYKQIRMERQDRHSNRQLLNPATVTKSDANFCSWNRGKACRAANPLKAKPQSRHTFPRAKMASNAAIMPMRLHKRLHNEFILQIIAL